MKHVSIIKKRDLAIGNFLTNTRMTFNKIAYFFFAALFAYPGGSPLTILEDKYEIGLYIFSFLFFLVVILLFVFLFGVAFAIFSSVLKKGVLGKHSFEFLKEGFTESTEYNESFHKYNAITDVFSRLGSVYIGLGGMHWHMLPKRDFKLKEDRLALMKFLQERSNL